MKINRLGVIVGFSLIMGGCIKDSNDSQTDNARPLLTVSCNSTEVGKMTGCWVSTQCELYDPTIHAARAASGNYIKESFAISSESGFLSSVISSYSDEYCENSVGKSEAIDHNSVVYGDYITNSDGLEVRKFKIQTGDAEKESYFYFNGTQICFPDRSFMLHMLSRISTESVSELDRSIDFDKCAEGRDKI